MQVRRVVVAALVTVIATVAPAATQLPETATYPELERWVLETGFAPNKPIQSGRNAELLRCNWDLRTAILRLGALAVQAPRTTDSRRWMITAAELTLTRTCEYVGPVHFTDEEYSSAYELSVRVGLRAFARATAEEAAAGALDEFLVGEWWFEGHPIEEPYGIGQLEPATFWRAHEWYRRAGFSDERTATVVRETARSTLRDYREYAASHIPSQRDAVARLNAWVEAGCPWPTPPTP